MYDKRDPRSALAPAAAQKKPLTAHNPCQIGRFYEDAPQIVEGGTKTWLIRGQNFIIGYCQAEAGATFTRASQPDEYVVLSPDPGMSVEITSEKGSGPLPGYSLAFVPPGRSTVTARSKGRIIFMYTPRSADLVEKCANGRTFTPDPNVPPFQNWPDPPDGLKLRVYSLDVPVEPGRFGRLFRCTTFMVNYLDPRHGPRDRTMVSPHHHDDFEQCSLALDGSYIHHLRWPWTVNMNIWRKDEHQVCHAPSVCVIPPPIIHTSTSEAPGLNQLVDIFAPPRLDFASKPGWVINEKDYPMPV